MTGRPLRADARRNRERVLAAAQEVFAAQGISAPLDEIARRAGVGAGTVYRHFPTKEALFEAAIVYRVETMTARARAAARDEDAGAAFFGFLRLMADEGGVKRDLVDALGARGADVLRGPSHEMRAALGDLLTRAQRDGSVRTDIDVDDLLAVLKGFFVAAHAGGDSGLTDRLFAVMSDGLRGR